MITSEEIISILLMVKKGFETLPPYLRFDNPNDSEEHRLIQLL
jgi:hypothetical protein